MLNISLVRFIWTFTVVFLVTSGLNWGIAEVLLNDWAMPRFEGFMRTMDTGGADPFNITKMTFGFMGPLLVTALLQSMLNKPAGWAARAVFVGLLVSLASFYGTYTFISGWGNVPWVPLMVTANCDMVSIVFGALFFGLLNKGSA